MTREQEQFVSDLATRHACPVRIDEDYADGSIRAVPRETEEEFVVQFDGRWRQRGWNRTIDWSVLDAEQ